MQKLLSGSTGFTFLLWVAGIIIGTEPVIIQEPSRPSASGLGSSNSIPDETDAMPLFVLPPDDFDIRSPPGLPTTRILSAAAHNLHVDLVLASDE